MFTLAEVSSGIITADMLKPLVDGITSNVGVILPVGLGIFAVFVGISVIPKIISKFVH